MKQQTFYSKVYRIVKKIPKGKVSTYKAIAELAGSPGAARAVGSAMKNNPDMNTIPCHRVVGSDGSMHGYSGGKGLITKVLMLKKEGVLFRGEKVILGKSEWRRN